MHCFWINQFSLFLRQADMKELPGTLCTGRVLSLSMCVRSPPTPDLCPLCLDAPNPATLPSQENLQPSWAPFSLLLPHPVLPPSPDFSSSKAPWFSSSQPPKWDFVTVYWNIETTVHVVLPSSICLPQASKSSSLNYRSELVTCLQNVCQKA